jgi:hypothetical protein
MAGGQLFDVCVPSVTDSTVQAKSIAPYDVTTNGHFAELGTIFVSYERQRITNDGYENGDCRDEQR